MAWRSPTTVNATEGMDSFIPYISEVTNFWFGRMVMIAIWVIFFFGYLNTKEEDYIGAIAIASYVTFVLGLFGWIFGLVAGLDFAIIIGAVIVGSLMLFLQKKQY